MKISDKSIIDIPNDDSFVNLKKIKTNILRDNLPSIIFKKPWSIMKIAFILRNSYSTKPKAILGGFYIFYVSLNIKLSHKN